jgi:hypothetical protein
MSSWTYGARANEMSHFSTTRTLSDFPLLVGEMLRRGNLRSRRQARRRTLIRKMKADQGDALAEHAAVCHPALTWMRLVNDEPVQIPRRVLDRKRSSFACCSEFRKGV